MKKLLLASVLVAMSVSESTAVEQTPIDETTMRNLQDTVPRDFFDPGSAQFRDLVLTDGGGVVCGFVNAKNKFGGYVGFRPFDYNIALNSATTYDPPGEVEALFKIQEILFRQSGCEKTLGAPLMKFFL